MLGGEVIEPTGRHFEGPLVYTAEIRNGKVIREWTAWDQLALLVQLGLMASQ